MGEGAYWDWNFWIAVAMAVLALATVTISYFGLMLHQRQVRQGEKHDDLQREFLALQKQQTAFQGRLAEIEGARERHRIEDREREQRERTEQQKATRCSSLHVDFGKTDKVSVYFLTVTNSGFGAAYEVAAFLDGKPIEEHRAWVFEKGRPFEKEIRGKYSSGPYRLLGAAGDGPPWELRIEWADESDGERRELKQPLRAA